MFRLRFILAFGQDFRVGAKRSVFRGEGERELEIELEGFYCRSQLYLDNRIMGNSWYRIWVFLPREQCSNASYHFSCYY